MSILHPLTPRLTTRHSLLVILGIWAVSLVITSPDMAIIQYEANISSGAQCFVCEYNHWNQTSFLNWWLRNQFILGNLICSATITPCDQSSCQEKSWEKEKWGYIFHLTERKTFGNAFECMYVCIVPFIKLKFIWTRSGDISFAKWNIWYRAKWTVKIVKMEPTLLKVI